MHEGRSIYLCGAVWSSMKILFIATRGQNNLGDELLLQVITMLRKQLLAQETR